MIVLSASYKVLFCEDNVEEECSPPSSSSSIIEDTCEVGSATVLFPSFSLSGLIVEESGFEDCCCCRFERVVVRFEDGDSLVTESSESDGNEGQQTILTMRIAFDYITLFILKYIYIFSKITS